MSWSDLERAAPPIAAAAQLQELVSILENCLNDALLGCLLHGSLAMSGFDPSRSDLDVLVIAHRDLTQSEKSQLARALLALSGHPHPIELSVVLEADLLPWRHPCPHRFHYGESQREAFGRGEIEVRQPADPDLAMHLMVARQRGIDLLGSWPPALLPEVPAEDFIDAIRRDFRWAGAQAQDLTDYRCTNACRTLAFLEQGLVLSKQEGLEWCHDRGIAPPDALKRLEVRLASPDAGVRPST